MSAAAVTSYDTIVYPDGVFPQTHPDRLCVLGKVFGLSPAPVETARILELGCGAGSNLIPLACQYPRSTCVGIDYAASQIAAGSDLIGRLGLGNIRLLAQDITALDTADLGQFDYIIAHGVYSWVPPQVADRLLAVITACLAPHGLAYVSYNVLPGWLVRNMGRDLMQFRVSRIADPHERAQAARDVLRFVTDNAILHERDAAPGSSAGACFMAMRGQADVLADKQDAVMLHDELETGGAVYFTQFAAHARDAGLAFLSEAWFAHSHTASLPEAERRALAGLTSDVLETEQYMDFLRCRAFRQSVLVHADAPVSRDIGPERLSGLHFAADMQRGPGDAEGQQGVTRFASSTGEGFSTGDPFMAACFDLLAEAYPAAYTLPALVQVARERARSGHALRSPAEDAATFAAGALTAYSRSKAMIELRASPVPCVAAVSAKPAASALARMQAADSATVTSQRHEPVTLDSTARALIQLLDGTRDLDALVHAMRGQVMVPHGVPDMDIQARLRHDIEHLLGWMARSALLVG